MKAHKTSPLSTWVLQTGEPLHIDGGNPRPMRAINLSNALVEAGHKVVLWSTAFYHQEKRQRNMAAITQVSPNLEIRLIPSGGYQRNIGLRRLIDHAQLGLNLSRLLQQEKQLPDVAFVGYPPIETAAVLVRWLGQRGVPSLLDIKDQWPSLFLDAVPAPLRPLGRVVLWPYFHYARRAMRDATGLSAMANGFLGWALEFAGRERTEQDGVFALTSPVGQVSALELAEARRWWDTHGIVDDRRARVSFVGSQSPAFDFRPVKEAAQLASDSNAPCDFVICGEGGSSAELRSMMRGLSNVHLPGWVDKPKIVALAERCHGALVPMRNTSGAQNSIPNKILDALSLGLPILTPLQGEVASLIAEHGVGLRYGTDTGRTLLDCIRSLVRDASLQESMASNARSLYVQRFSFALVYGGLVKHLAKLAQRPGGK